MLWLFFKIYFATMKDIFLIIIICETILISLDNISSLIIFFFLLEKIKWRKIFITCSDVRNLNFINDVELIQLFFIEIIKIWMLPIILFFDVIIYGRLIKLLLDKYFLITFWNLWIFLIFKIIVKAYSWRSLEFIPLINHHFFGLINLINRNRFKTIHCILFWTGLFI